MNAWALSIGNVTGAPIRHLPPEEVVVTKAKPRVDPPALRVKIERAYCQSPAGHCQHCGIELSIHNHNIRYCSLDCRAKAGYAKRTAKRAAAAIERKAGLVCQHCYQPMPAEAHGHVKYCSAECFRSERNMRKRVTNA